MLKLTGSNYARKIIREVLSIFPHDIYKHIDENVWFICSFDDAWAYTFDSGDLRGRKLIFLSDELLARDKKQIMYTIAHEIGHVVLGHKNSIYKNQTHHEVKTQEKEAHSFAKRYLK